ncbi:MAG TPA: hypothetical protein DCP97_04635 [Ruminococcaceae bacterium]|nr:hypothetical protein [Oscillospiraceae bacterium]
MCAHIPRGSRIWQVRCEGLIRLNDCELQPCKACLNGPCKRLGPTACIHKDDGGWLAEKFYESDGYIMAAPVWSLAPASIVSVFRDRIFGYKADVAGWERIGTPGWAKNYKKHRPGALISVGGALTKNWTSLGMATLYTTTISAQTNVVDQMDVYGVSKHGEAAIREDYLLRARYLGENLGHAVLNPQIDWCGRWLGSDDEEACPSCHTSLMVAKPGRNYVECAVCGRKGYVSLENGNLKYAWPEDPQNRLTMMGKYDHIREIERHGMGRPENYDELVREKSKKYKDWNDCVLTPPSKNVLVNQNCNSTIQSN